MATSKNTLRPPPAKPTTGKQSVWDRIPDLPADDPLFKAGFVIGQRRSAGSRATGKPPGPPPDKPSGRQ